MTDFAGFPEEALEFYEGLEADNSKAYWADHKAAYEASVRAPMEALLGSLAAEFGPGKIFRPYRDVRFARDKSPYKTQTGAVVGGPDGTSLYVQISAEGLLVGGGMYGPAGDQVERFRAAALDDTTGAALEQIVARLTDDGLRFEGDRMKTRPRGVSADHPRIELLRHRSWVGMREWEPAEWLHTAGARDRVAGTWRAMGDLNDWLGRHVGVSRQPNSP